VKSLVTVADTQEQGDPSYYPYNSDSDEKESVLISFHKPSSPRTTALKQVLKIYNDIEASPSEAVTITQNDFLFNIKNNSEREEREEGEQGKTKMETVLVTNIGSPYEDKQVEEVIERVKKMFKGKIFGVTRLPSAKEIGTMNDIIKHPGYVSYGDGEEYVMIKGQLVEKGSAFDTSKKKEEQLFRSWEEDEGSELGLPSPKRRSSAITAELLNNEDELNKRIDARIHIFAETLRMEIHEHIDKLIENGDERAEEGPQGYPTQSLNGKLRWDDPRRSLVASKESRSKAKHEKPKASKRYSAQYGETEFHYDEGVNPMYIHGKEVKPLKGMGPDADIEEDGTKPVKTKEKGTTNSQRKNKRSTTPTKAVEVIELMSDDTEGEEESNEIPNRKSDRKSQPPDMYGYGREDRKLNRVLVINEGTEDAWKQMSIMNSFKKEKQTRSKDDDLN